MPSDTTQLCTIDQVKEYLNVNSNVGIPFDSGDDQLLTRMVMAASNFIENWLSRRLGVHTYREIQDGRGGRALTLSQSPIIEIQSVSVAGVPLVAAPTDGSASQAGYLFTDTDLIRIGGVFPRFPQNVIVVYQAGYDPLPEAAVQACIEIVALRYRERKHIGENSVAMAEAGTTSFTQKDILPSTASALKPLRRVVPVRAFSTIIG